MPQGKSKVAKYTKNLATLLWPEERCCCQVQPSRLNYSKHNQFYIYIMLAQAACVRHACLRAPCVAWPLLLPSFSLSSFLFFSSFSLRLLLLTHFGESPMCENLFPPIFWHNYVISVGWKIFLKLNKLRTLICQC